MKYIYIFLCHSYKKFLSIIYNCKLRPPTYYKAKIVRTTNTHVYVYLYRHCTATMRYNTVSPTLLCTPLTITDSESSVIPGISQSSQIALEAASFPRFSSPGPAEQGHILLLDSKHTASILITITLNLYHPLGRICSLAADSQPHVHVQPTVWKEQNSSSDAH